MVHAAIYGCAGLQLSADERAFFRDADPWGFIVFARNISAPSQLRALVENLRETVGREAAVLIDQEGGRVQRLRPPDWPAYPPGRAYGAAYAGNLDQGIRAAWLGGALIGSDLISLGIDVDCLPVLDVPAPGGHDVIGDRAYGTDPQTVAALGRAAAEGLLASGVLPVIKHIPGHGRAGADSHFDLPRVEASREALEMIDFAPFKALNDMPLAMTAHVVYTAFDPGLPATTSPLVIERVIRGAIGFDGLLMSDDLSMQALSGTLGERARDSFAAGCDLVLHCNGDMAEMRLVAAETPMVSGAAALRAERAERFKKQRQPLDVEAARAEFSRLLADFV